jgi:anti-sigma factor RsiW
MNKHLGDKLIDYAWDMLTPQERAEADVHLRDCAACRGELAQHQSLVNKLASTVPAMTRVMPTHVREGWPAIAAWVPQLRKATTPTRRSSRGFIAVGLAMSAAAVLIVAVMVQAWFGLGRPPFTATALYASATPIASATYTPERPTVVATPVSWMYAPPLEAPRPLPAIATTKPETH